MAKKHTFFLLAMFFLLTVPTFAHVNRLISSDNCKQPYGVMPCTNSVLGNAFLILVYFYCIFRAAKLLTDGSESLLEILDPGIIGGLFLPILSSLPSAVIILASGLSESKETAQSQLSVGMGLLAGTAVTLLTLLWGSCIIVGKHDLKIPHSFPNFTWIVVRTNQMTYVARIMVVSVTPIIIVLLAQVFKRTFQSCLAILISLIVSFSLLVSYCLYQIIQPWIQTLKLDYAKHKHSLLKIKERLKFLLIRQLLKDEGEPNKDAIQSLFEKIDKDNDGYISATELKAFLLGVLCKKRKYLDNIDDIVEYVLRDFDTSGDSRISRGEFVKNISKWLDEARHPPARRIRFKHLYQLVLSHWLGEGKDTPDGWKAVFMALLGTVIAAVFADPLVNAVDNFSTATTIPSFFVSFVILPFASCSDVVPALLLARKKLKTAPALTFSEIYRLVTMSNILGLLIFLALVYIRQLPWHFSAEMLIILIVCIVMGLLAGFRTTFPLWICVVAYALYPFSLALVYVLDNFLGLA